MAAQIRILSPTVRFVLVCVAWTALHSLLAHATLPAGMVVPFAANVFVLAIFVSGGSAFVAFGMKEKSRWDLVAAWIAMALLLAICLLTISTIFVASFFASGGWH